MGNDAYGDGVCCQYGQGSYEITMNGEVQVSGGEFGSQKEEEFGSCDSNPTPPAEPPVAAPTQPPVAPPVAAPTQPPVAPPVAAPTQPPVAPTPPPTNGPTPSPTVGA